MVIIRSNERWFRGLLDGEIERLFEGAIYPKHTIGIEEVAEGKFRVHNALRERLPRLAPVTASTAIETIEAIVFESEEEPEAALTKRFIKLLGHFTHLVSPRIL